MVRPLVSPFSLSISADDNSAFPATALIEECFYNELFPLDRFYVIVQL